MAVIALDSFDLPRAGCTTHVASLLILYLYERGFKLLDFPRLVRLNPAVPWKTRGNASIAFEVNGDVEDVFKLSKRFLEDLEGSLLVSDGWVKSDMYPRAVEKVIAPDEVRRVIKEENIEFFGKSEAAVGALAALSTDLSDVPNFELIAYRLPERIGTRRECKPKEEYDTLYNLLYPCVHESSFRVICPRGDDPVLYGLRGRNTACLVTLVKAIESEPVSLFTIFRTNQHSFKPSSEAKYIYDYGRKELDIDENDIAILGEDIKIKEYMLFKETGITKLFKELASYERLKGELELDVMIKPGISSISRIRIEKLVAYERRAPRCPRCGAPMKSLGAKTLMRRCKRCGFVKEEISRLKLIDIREIELYPIEGRKLHLEGAYRGAVERMRKAVCDYLEPGCAVTRGFGLH